jgi:predicted transcriptional regulator
MAKTKTNVTDFMDLMDEEINSSERAAFHPKTDNKQVTNGYQTDNGTEKETITNRQQTDSKQIANLSEKNETDNKQVTKRITERITIGQQTDNKQITKSGFESLVGNEKNLLLLIFKECLRIGNLISPEITLSHIYESLKINPGVAKMVIHRLVKKGVIKREISKTGRGGWIKFSIQKELYQDLRIRESDNKEITNGYQSDNKQVTKRVTEQITSGPYSSSNNLNIITTNTDEPEFSAEITLPNNLSRFGISKNNLQKLVDDKLCSLELVQKSIEALSFDVENGKTGNLASILFA